MIVRHIVLFYRVYSATAFIPSENVDIGVLKHHSWHSAPFLVELGYFLPPVQVNRVPLAEIKDAVYRAAANRIDII